MEKSNMEKMFVVFNDMAELNLGRGDALDEVIASAYDLGTAMGKEELVDEKVAAIPAEALEKPNPNVVVQQQQAWERFQQRLKEQQKGKQLR